MSPFRSLLLALPLSLAFQSIGQSQVPLLGIGDSLGEGVQSANAFFESQPNTYLKRVATQMDVPFSQPLLSTSATAFVFTDKGRARLYPTTDPADLAVSGATSGDIINSVAVTGTPTTEYDLVLPPYYGLSQLQIVEQLKPKVVLAWVGNDDLISLVLDYSNLNNPSPTPLPEFTSNYEEIVSRLKATGAKVVMANIPDLTKVGFLFDNNDLTRYSGTNYNLPSGSRTTLATALLLKLGALDSSVLTNPAYVLSAAQLTSIQQQIQTYNAVIQETATAAGFPVLNAYELLDGIATTPLTIEGIPVGTGYNQGAFSLDGIHPSDTGYAFFAQAFITTANKAYALNIPLIPQTTLVSILNADPFIDFSGTGVVPGRPDTGLLETLGPILGLSGGPGFSGSTSSRVDPAVFMREYYRWKGQDPNTRWERQDVIKAVNEMLGIGRWVTQK